MTVMTHARNPGGFTLLELLVALTVLGFLLVGLAQGVHFGLLTWVTEVRLTDGNEGIDTLDNTVRHVIEGADPGDDLDPAPFIGSRDSLDCITALPNATGPSRSRHIRAVLLVDANHRLVLRWRPYVRATRLGSPVASTETALLRGVSRIELAFWRPGGGWVNAWRSPDLPSLVRIRVFFPAGDRRHWPDIVAAPMLDRL
jgi:general secretion pathway protein J